MFLFVSLLEFVLKQSLKPEVHFTRFTPWSEQHLSRCIVAVNTVNVVRLNQQSTLVTDSHLLLLKHRLQVVPHLFDDKVTMFAFVKIVSHPPCVYKCTVLLVGSLYTQRMFVKIGLFFHFKWCDWWLFRDVRIANHYAFNITLSGELNSSNQVAHHTERNTRYREFKI
jgi:hypothetical protein